MTLFDLCQVIEHRRPVLLVFRHEFAFVVLLVDKYFAEFERSFLAGVFLAVHFILILRAVLVHKVTALTARFVTIRINYARLSSLLLHASLVGRDLIQTHHGSFCKRFLACVI